MTRNVSRNRSRAQAVAIEPGRHPHRHVHADRRYEQAQNDTDGSILLCAFTLLALVTLVVLGLV